MIEDPQTAATLTMLEVVELVLVDVLENLSKEAEAQGVGDELQ